MSGQGVNLVWPVNLRKSQKVVQPQGPSSLSDRRAVHHREIRFHDVPSIVPSSHLLQLAVLMSTQKPVTASDPHPFAIRAPSTEGSVYEPSTPAMTCHLGSRLVSSLWRSISFTPTMQRRQFPDRKMGKMNVQYTSIPRFMLSFGLAHPATDELRPVHGHYGHPPPYLSSSAKKDPRINNCQWSTALC
eukprot:366297-Chlamydomonas_euryale.AAC.7